MDRKFKHYSKLDQNIVTKNACLLNLLFLGGSEVYMQIHTVWENENVDEKPDN